MIDSSSNEEFEAQVAGLVPRAEPKPWHTDNQQSSLSHHTNDAFKCASKQHVVKPDSTIPKLYSQGFMSVLYFKTHAHS